MSAPPKPGWASLSDEELLDLRLRDLDVSIEGSFVEGCIGRLAENLASRGLRFRPHFWAAAEWFSPLGVPGIGVPFYLLHPRLAKLERRQMLEVEGGKREECLRILRHECGHAIQHAYRLNRKRRWQATFGRSSQPYPEFYQPNPASRRHVQHLRLYYAQSHPDEDFAETFAVWLQPRHVWRRRYRGWPALRKLEFVDELMAEIADQPAPVRNRRKVDPLHQLDTTLREHYREKLERYPTAAPDVYDRDLRLVFSDTRPAGGGLRASTFLRRHRRRIRGLVSRWTGEYQFTLDQVMDDMVQRTEELDLWATGDPSQLLTDFAVMLGVHTTHFLYDKRQWMPM